ncbi:MAG: hypothetical protein ABGX16_05315 [Pirellulales bacterium]
MNQIISSVSHWMLAAVTPTIDADRPRELISYEFFRLESLSDSPWLVLGLVVIGLAFLLFTIGSYSRESRSLPRFAGTLLCLLRLLALSGAVLFFMNLQKRTDQQITTESQVAILIDSSQSMSVRDVSQRVAGQLGSGHLEGGHLEGGQTLTRSEAILHALRETSWIETLRQKHNVTLTAFDRESHRLLRWDRLVPQQVPSQNKNKNPEQTNSEQKGQPDQPAGESAQGANEKPIQLTSNSTPSWTEKLMPLGAETRLGGALNRMLTQHASEPLAGVILITDGGQNSGLDPLTVWEMSAKDTGQKVPVFTVGVGSTQPRRNMRVQELIAPSRLYPNDQATVRGLVQADGFAGRTVDVELYLRELSGPEAEAGTQGTGTQRTGTQGTGGHNLQIEQPGGRKLLRGDRIGIQRLTFASDTEVLPVEFEIEPVTAGRLQLALRLAVPTDDQFTGDNIRRTEVEVVDSKLRILLLASGATRDYRFLRNQLHRDSHAQVDVCLQMAPPGLSQDANQILAAFPTTKEELYVYDCIVAFDPNWSVLDGEQVELLEKWVGQEAGGLIAIAGPIHTAHWIQSPEHAKIRALYPIQFQRRLTLLDDGQFGSQVPWPIAFTRDGWESPYLWLSSSKESSQEIWSRFPGVYGCYAVKGPKPGARVLGSYSDPDAGISTEPPVYLAEHFYGAGRVFYMGSGEMWRLRQHDPGYFEMLTTQLLRHVSQGRLLRGSSRGSLMVERDRFTVGDTVTVRAQLATASREPLLATSVMCHTISPSGVGRNMKLKVVPGKAGNFIGQFTVLEQGTHRIELPIPGLDIATDTTDSSEATQLMRRIEVTLPNLEFEQTRRDESLLAALATRTGGRYYTSINAAINGSDNLLPVAQMIESRAEVKTIRGAADAGFTEKLNHILLGIICGSLCLEWFFRRLLKLA